MATKTATKKADPTPDLKPTTHKVRFLMSAAEATAVVKQHPSLVTELTDKKDGDVINAASVPFGPGIKVPEGELDDAIVIGFNIPMNLACRASKIAEVAIQGNAAKRQNLAAKAVSGDKAVAEEAAAELAKALEAMSQIPVRVYLPPKQIVQEREAKVQQLSL